MNTCGRQSGDILKCNNELFKNLMAMSQNRRTWQREIVLVSEDGEGKESWRSTILTFRYSVYCLSSGQARPMSSSGQAPQRHRGHTPPAMPLKISETHPEVWQYFMVSRVQYLPLKLYPTIRHPSAPIYPHQEINASWHRCCSAGMGNIFVLRY